MTDGPLTFHVLSAEILDTIGPTTLGEELRAKGVFFIVRMTIDNATAEPAGYWANLQKLIVAGNPVDSDLNAVTTLDVGSIVENIAPRESTDVTVVFDIPGDARVDAIRVSGDLTSKGTDVPLPDVARP